MLLAYKGKTMLRGGTVLPALVARNCVAYGSLCDSSNVINANATEPLEGYPRDALLIDARLANDCDPMVLKQFLERIVSGSK